MTHKQQAKCSKSLTARIKRKRDDASRRGKLGVAARRAKMDQVAYSIQYAGTIRYVMASGKVRQVILRSDGQTVCVDGGGRMSYRGFCAAMNRKLWRAVK